MRWQIGNMQGRLVPSYDGSLQCFPRDRWQEEFALAGRVGFDCIEWLYDSRDAAVNPLANDDGVDQIHNLTKTHGVAVRSVCAHYFVEQPLLGVSEAEQSTRIGALCWLIGRAALLGAGRIVLPVESATPYTGEPDLGAVVATILPALVEAEHRGVELHIETQFDASTVRKLLDRIPSSALRVTFDSGNAAYLGHSTTAALHEYGSRIGCIHIKDKLLRGASVAPGMGDAEFAALFEGLATLGYAGDFVMEVARCPVGEELEYASRNLEFVRRHLRNAFCMEHTNA